MTEEIIFTDPIVDQEPEAVPEAPADLTPTVIEAQAMFAGNPGLASVHTTEGILHRDGVLQRTAIGE